MMAIPEIITLNTNDIPADWTIHLYNDYHPFLVEDDRHELTNFLEKEIRYCQEKFKAHPYRLEKEINGFPFSFGIYPNTKNIYIGSQKLSRELLFLKAVSLDKKHRPDNLKQYKDHIAFIAAPTPTNFPSTWERVTYHQELPAVDQPQSFPKDFKTKLANETQQISNLIQSYSPSTFENISDIGLKLSANYAIIRLHLLKFLAILPCLSHDSKGHEVKRLLLEGLRRLETDNSLAKEKGLKGQSRPLPGHWLLIMKVIHFLVALFPAGLLSKLIRESVKIMAKRFIAGESIHSSDKSLADLKKTNRDATIDRLGELVVSKHEADLYAQGVIEIIKGMNKHYTLGDKNKAGILRAHVSIKVSALCHDFKPQALEATYQNIAPRLKEILLTAKNEQVFINIDAEHYHYRDAVFYVYKRILLETDELKQWRDTGIVLQSYLRDASTHLKDIEELAKTRQILMPIRLVKGAYWDAETIEARAHNFEPPQFLNKEETDLHFRQMAWQILEKGNHLQLCLASHNFVDHCWAETLKETKFSSAPTIEHQCLHMTYEGLSCALAQRGWPTRNYVPVGPLIVGMAYLVRRIMENSSQVGVLSMMRSHQKISTLSGPEEIHSQKLQNHQLQLDPGCEKVSADFESTPPLRLYLKRHLESFIHTLDKTKKNFELNQSSSTDKHSVFSSSYPSLKVGEISFSTDNDVQSTIIKMANAWEESTWKDSLAQRIGVLMKARDLFLIERNSLATLIVYEAGKTWTEALGDVDEAIDFIHFYCSEQTRLLHLNPELKGRGVFAVICPWNFPLAIPLGMTVSALVAGNAVALKSAEQTPLVADEMVSLLHLAGVPKDSLHHFAGEGNIGAAMTSHPHIVGAIFTGSKTVGTIIYEQLAGKLVEINNEWMTKKVIAEMGGKNAIIITNNAELDETISGCLQSAFGHAGQKCSAASRIIIDHRLFSIFAERFTQAVNDLQVGPSDDPNTFINPLISKEDVERVQAQVKEAIKEANETKGKVWTNRSEEPYSGFNIGPVVIELTAEQALKKDSYAQKELFAPVVHLIPAKDLDEAVTIYNSTEYALTGGIFGQSQDDLEYLLERLESGNIYVNRSITGARVAIEPFGGFKMSGTGPKAGGRHYLLPLQHVPKHAELSNQAPAPFTGPEYLYNLPRASGRSLRERINRVQSILELVLNRYESLFSKIDELEKHQLKELKNALKKELHLYLTKPMANKYIPGQINVDHHNFTRQRGLIISTDENISFEALACAFSASSIGSGLLILTTNEKMFQLWDQLAKLFYKEGISKYSFEVCYVNQHIVTMALKDPHFSFVFLDSLNRHQLEELGQIASQGKESFIHMKNILTPLEKIPATTWKDFWSQFLWIRSMAINIMRHGAPLDLKELG